MRLLSKCTPKCSTESVDRRSLYLRELVWQASWQLDTCASVYVTCALLVPSGQWALGPNTSYRYLWLGPMQCFVGPFTEEYLSGIMAAKVDENSMGNSELDVEFESWLKRITVKYKKLTSCQRLAMLSRLVDLCSPSELYEYSNYVTDLFRRDFLSLLPAELVDHVLSYVDHESLLRACCVGIRTYMLRATDGSIGSQ